MPRHPLFTRGRRSSIHVGRPPLFCPMVHQCFRINQVERKVRRWGYPNPQPRIAPPMLHRSSYRDGCIALYFRLGMRACKQNVRFRVTARATPTTLSETDIFFRPRSGTGASATCREQSTGGKRSSYLWQRGCQNRGPRYALV